MHSTLVFLISRLQTTTYMYVVVGHGTKYGLSEFMDILTLPDDCQIYPLSLDRMVGRILLIGRLMIGIILLIGRLPL